jgi:hypothetical protein
LLSVEKSTVIYNFLNLKIQIYALMVFEKHSLYIEIIDCHLCSTYSRFYSGKTIGICISAPKERRVSL